MDATQFRKQAHKVVDWIADYYEQLEDRPVKSSAQPGDIKKQLPASAPEQAESFEAVMRDVDDIILPGITHWQHPRFMAYFPANTSAPSILAEMITAALGVQGMVWQTSPAAEELEERVMEWLRKLCKLPETFTGVIQDTASTSTLCALLMAREKATGWNINEEGWAGHRPLVVYGSEETHSSIEKDVKIAGYGRSRLRKVAVDDHFAMRPDALEKAIKQDLEAGRNPACVIATIGTTGSTAIDPVRRIGEICEQYDIFLHVDAAFAGSALLLDDKRWMADGLEKADSYVFNPHKWLFTNFDCSAFYVRDVDALLRTFEILPEYLKTREDREVNNYRDWGIPLGRRFRALKLWFVMRMFGAEGLRNKLTNHLELAGWMQQQVEKADDFEQLAPMPLNTLCFRYHPPGTDDDDLLNEINAELLQKIQDSGFAYLTHTKLNGQFTIRMVIGQTNVQRQHVEDVWKSITRTARNLDIPKR